MGVVEDGEGGDFQGGKRTYSTADTTVAGPYRGDRIVLDCVGDGAAVAAPLVDFLPVLGIGFGRGFGSFVRASEGGSVEGIDG